MNRPIPSIVTPADATQIDWFDVACSYENEIGWIGLLADMAIDLDACGNSQDGATPAEKSRALLQGIKAISDASRRAT